VTLNSRNQIDYLSIGDFDTAKHVSEGNVPKTTIGTPGYIAPEILRSKNQIQYSFSVDSEHFLLLFLPFSLFLFFSSVWSFGMVMYEIMTLKRPFDEIPAMKLNQLCSEGLIPTLPPQIEERYKGLIPIWKKCLEKNPADRPTISELKAFFASLI
jgi:serine/threonine protein kinase